MVIRTSQTGPSPGAGVHAGPPTVGARKPGRALAYGRGSTHGHVRVELLIGAYSLRSLAEAVQNAIERLMTSPAY
jgi:hypothetical protein